MSTPLEDVAPPTSFTGSRRLTGPNRYCRTPAVVLEPLGPRALDSAAHEAWRAEVVAVAAALGWPAPLPVVQVHAHGTILAMVAPEDHLFTATLVNECAWEHACGLFAASEAGTPPPPVQWQGESVVAMHPATRDVATLAAHFSALAAREFNAELRALRDAAAARALPDFVDDGEVSIGAGSGSRTWPIDHLPALHAVPWSDLHSIPTALITGSNGKTTTVRLLAAMARQAGKVAGYCCTEGIAIDGHIEAEGDYSGPAGARQVLRDRRVEIAVLETARGGILRRGLAVRHAEVAVITNVSADHFGEYGIDSLDDLARVKRVVAHALPAQGTLVLNADDPTLLALADGLSCQVALFASAFHHAALVRLRAAGGAVCGGEAGQLRLAMGGRDITLGDIADMPLTLNGTARHNIANIAAASLAAAALGLDTTAIAATLRQFGGDRDDNPGRLERWSVRGATVLIDYAHNPDGMARLLDVAIALQRNAMHGASGAIGRLGLLLGHAGNRTDDAISDLATAAAAYRPDLVVLKELPSMLRGRALGEVPRLLRSGLRAGGLSQDAVHEIADEEHAAAFLIDWARPGDVVVLAVHQAAARRRIVEALTAIAH